MEQGGCQGATRPELSRPWIGTAVCRPAEQTPTGARGARVGTTGGRQ